MKKLILGLSAFVVLVVIAVVAVVISVNNSLPNVMSLEDYKPLLVTNVYARDGRKIGEFFRERRVLVPYSKIPKVVVQAFMAAEDSEFFEHSGINLQAILRATLVNLKSGHTVQGGSTITQQVAKTLMLSSERTLTRKIKDVLLALKMEKSLSKEDIMYLYLNQIFLGQRSYGIGMAAETYFRKPVENLNVAEAAMLAGLPQAPSRYSPVVNPKRAKERQRYVLKQMAEKGFIPPEQAQAAMKAPITVYIKEKYEEIAPFYLETVRQMVVKKLGEDVILDHGVQIHTSLDLDKQLAAQESVKLGLRNVDKRQGYRGAKENIPEPQREPYLAELKKKLEREQSDARSIDERGEITIVPENNQRGRLESSRWLEVGQLVPGIVRKIDDEFGLVWVQLPGSQGVIDIDTMKWARPPNPDIPPERDMIGKPSQAVKVGDLVEVRIASHQFSSERLEKMKKTKIKGGFKGPDTSHQMLLNLEQEPIVEGALLSLDLETDEVIAMVGGTNFEKSEFNRTIQAARQTGSSFKSIVYMAALDKGYTPATPILDAPVVFESEVNAEDSEGQDPAKETKSWRPTNHSKTFEGDIIFRNALVKSLNVPTVRIIEDIGVPWSLDYAQRMGIFSPLNKDFTLALGSSSVTLYEMTKAFGQMGRLGKRSRPLMIHKVVDRKGSVLAENLDLDERFQDVQKPIEDQFEKRRLDYLELQKQLATSPDSAELKTKISKIPPIFFEDPDQLIDPRTAYLITTLLRATIEDPGGTGVRARALGREVAGKTGSSNGYFDGWFIGFTPQISTGVWVGFDQERSIGVGEVGGRVALPIWLQYMQDAHKTLPEKSFAVPPGIVFASIDSKTGKLPSASSKTVIRQAFKEGTEPSIESAQKEEEADFYKQDLQE